MVPSDSTAQANPWLGFVIYGCCPIVFVPAPTETFIAVDMLDTATGVVEVSTVPLPSCPEAFAPQQFIAPESNTAHVLPVWLSFEEAAAVVGTKSAPFVDICLGAEPFTHHLYS